MNPELSIVIPIYNEEKNIVPLFTRLTNTLDRLDRNYEIIFVNDGSRDRSSFILNNIHTRNPSQVVIVEFIRNFGQHMAILAGFEQAKGNTIVTLDGDLQNPPEEIPKLLELINQGHDLVSGIRLYERQDNWFRKYISILINKIRLIITNIKMTDHGCMLRAYSRNIIDLVIANNESSVFIPALAYSYAINPTEIKVAHEKRSSGNSKYSIYSLIKLNFDLMTGYSLIPIQIFTVLGCIVSLLSIIFIVSLLFRRLLLGLTIRGTSTMFALSFLLIGILLVGLGIMGEYIGRIYKEVRKRPRFAIEKILERKK